MVEQRTSVIVVGLMALSVLAAGASGGAVVSDGILAQEEEPGEAPDEAEAEEEGDEDPAENETAVNETAGNETVANETAVNETVANETAGNETTGNETDQEADVTFENQTSNGTAVMVNSTTLPDGGFLAVYNTTMEAPLGNSSFVESGTQENVSVTLDESLTENGTLVVLAFQTADGDETFELGTNEVYLSDGQAVMDSATVNVTDGAEDEPDAENETANATEGNESAAGTENETMNATEGNETSGEAVENETTNATADNETAAAADNETANATADNETAAAADNEPTNATEGNETVAGEPGNATVAGESANETVPENASANVVGEEPENATEAPEE